MKILIIDNSLDTTGAFISLLLAISKLENSEFQFVYLLPQNSKCLELLTARGEKAYGLPFIEISRRVKDLFIYFPRLIVNARKIRRLIKKEQIDLVHVNDIYNMLGLVLKEFYGIPVITHIRRMPESFPRFIYNIWSKMHIKFADKIIVITEANKNAILPNKKTVIMYDSVQENEILPKYEPRTSLNKTVSILYLANYNDGKGHLHALKVIKRALEELNEWKFELNFYGGDFGMGKNVEYKQKLIDFAEKNGIAPYVKFYNKATEIEKVYKSYDLVLNLSDSESFSRVTLDALFFGIPIIATDVGGTREMVLHGKTGLLAPPKDIDMIFDVFKQMILNDELRCNMAKNAQKFVRDEFSSARLSNIIKSLYLELKK